MLSDVPLCDLFWFYFFTCLSSYTGVYFRMLYGYHHYPTSYRNVIDLTSSFILNFFFHISRDVPWYADSEWNNVKGQLSTVDRHYGHVHSVIHSIGTHQIHHLFTKVPHYHLGMTSIP